MKQRNVRIWPMALVPVALIFAGCGATQLEAQAAQETANKEVLQSFLGMFMSGDWDGFDQVIASDCVLHEPGGTDLVGLDQMKAAWLVAYAPLTNLNAGTIAEASEGEYLMDFLVMEAIYEGEYMGRQVSGVPVTFFQAETMHIVDGKIVEWWVEFDRLRMAEELGFELQSK